MVEILCKEAIICLQLSSTFAVIEPAGLRCIGAYGSYWLADVPSNNYVFKFLLSETPMSALLLFSLSKFVDVYFVLGPSVLLCA